MLVCVCVCFTRVFEEYNAAVHVYMLCLCMQVCVYVCVGITYL